MENTSLSFEFALFGKQNEIISGVAAFIFVMASLWLPDLFEGSLALWIIKI